MRAATNERVRPEHRPPIFSLPDELLRHIFEYVRGETGMYELHFFPRNNASGITNVRLACSRFYVTSSHLLLHHVNVGLTAQSLAHLDEVSQHPFISKGVLGVTLFLGPFYDSALAGNIRTFATYRAAKLRHSIEWWERDIEMHIDDGDPAEIYQEAIAKGIPLAESWEEAADQGIDVTRVDHVMLADAHTLYCQRYEHQKAVIDGFAQTVGSAMRRMPSATWVKAEDRNIFNIGLSSWPSPNDMNDPVLLREKLLVPLDWHDARVYGLGPAPFDIIGGLLLSLHQAEIHLKGLDIQTPPPTFPNTPTTLNEQDLCVAIRQLKAIKVRPKSNIRHVYWAERAADEWMPFMRFLSRLLRTESLQNIDLDFYYMCDNHPPPSLSMAPIILSYIWPSLTSLHFNGPFHLEELRAVVQRLEKDVDLQWGGYLLSGSWAEVLDIVKEYDSWETCIGHINGSVYGQEADELTQQEWDFIFRAGIGIYDVSRATKFTQRDWLQKSNPVRDWENGEIVIPEEEEVESEYG